MVKFSVVIPVYNVEKYLRECLDSVVNQSLSDIEIICINDGSTDGSLEILKEYALNDNRFVIMSQENKGQGVARNNAVKIARGKYLLFVDPDDWIELDTCEVLYNKFEETQAEVIRFDVNLYNEKTKVTTQLALKKEFELDPLTKLVLEGEKFIPELHRKYINRKYYYIDSRYGVWFRAYLTSFIQENNIRCSETKLGEDSLFTIGVLCLAKNIYYSDKYFYWYRKREGSATNQCSEIFFDMFENFRSIKEFLIEKNLYKKNRHGFESFRLGSLLWAYERIPQGSCTKFENMCKEVLSENDFKEFKKKSNKVLELSFAERIFSVKNYYWGMKKYKIITLFNLQFKLSV